MGVVSRRAEGRRCGGVSCEESRERSKWGWGPRGGGPWSVGSKEAVSISESREAVWSEGVKSDKESRIRREGLERRVEKAWTRGTSDHIPLR